MHPSLNRHFLVNPKKDQVRLNEHLRLLVKVVKASNTKKMKFKMNLDVVKEQGLNSLTYLLESQP